MLVVIDHWDIHGPLELFLYPKAAGSRDILQTDGPKGGSEHTHSLHDLLFILSI